MNKAKSDHQAWEFATQRKAWLLTQARSLCRNEADAEDLVQEALLRFIQSFSSSEILPNERLCEEWLVRTLAQLFLDQCRSRRLQAREAKNPLLHNDTVERQDPSPLPTYETITDDQFAQALGTLSSHTRSTFELRAAGMSYQDIARSLGISVGSVAKRLHDARVRLRKLLEQYTESGDH